MCRNGTKANTVVPTSKYCTSALSGSGFAGVPVSKLKDVQLGASFDVAGGDEVFDGDATVGDAVVVGAVGVAAGSANAGSTAKSSSSGSQRVRAALGTPPWLY